MVPERPVPLLRSDGQLHSVGGGCCTGVLPQQQYYC